MPDFLSTMPVPNSNSTIPNFADMLKTYTDSIRNSGTFQDAYKSLTPTAPGTLDPGYQSTLDQIKSNADYYGKQASSAAVSLAAKRGLSGSSIEQFGVQTGVNNVNRTAADETAAVYQQNLQRQQQLQDQQANALFGVTSTGVTGASDEIASERNMQYQQQMLQLQQQLGQQGIDVAKGNIDASKSIAQQNGIYSLLGSLGPSFLAKAFPGLGGGSMFGGGGTAAASAAGGFTPYAAGGLPGPYAAGAAGAAGTGLAGFAAANPGISLVAAGAGAMAIDKFTAPTVTNALGNTTGAAARALLNPIGSQLNLAKNLVTNPKQTVSNAVSKVFGGSGDGTGSGNSTATEQRKLDSERDYLTNLKQTDPAAYQQQAQSMINDISQRVGSLTGKSSAWANAINPNWQKFVDAGLVKAVNGQWVAG